MGTYPDYESLKLDWPAPRVLRITMSRGKANAMDFQLHHDIAHIWRYVDDDPDVSVVILTGEGRYFSAGGDMEMEKRMMSDPEFRMANWKDGRAFVMNMIECNKPIISAINGPAAGGGMVGAVLADISIAARSAFLVDAHTRLGVAAGDYSALLWPLLCGMAKAKYYVLTCERIPAEEAERIGLITMCVDDDVLQEKALEIAIKLSNGAQSAIRWTKYAFNNWLRANWPIFDASLALETLGFTGAEVKEGSASFQEKRAPNFDPKCPL